MPEPTGDERLRAALREYPRTAERQRAVREAARNPDEARIRSEAERETVRRIVERLRAKLAAMELHEHTGDPQDYGYACAWDELAAEVAAIDREFGDKDKGGEPR